MDHSYVFGYKEMKRNQEEGMSLSIYVTSN